MTRIARAALTAVAAIVAVTAVLSVVSLLRGPIAQGRVGEPPRAASDDTVLREAVAALAAEVAALRDSQRNLRADKAPLAAPPATANAPPQMEEVAAEPPQPSAAQYSAQLQQALNTETLDASWARRVEGDLTAAFSAPAVAGSRLLKAECRTTLCRVEYEHDDRAAKQRFRGSLMTMAALRNVTVFAQPSDPEQLHYVMFVSREGATLPAPLPE